MLKDYLFLRGVKSLSGKTLSKWGTITQLDNDLGEDIYKNKICIMSSIQSIISLVIKVRVDGATY